MKIKFTPENRSKIEQAIAATAGRVEATVTWDEVEDAIGIYKKNQILSKKDSKGARIVINGFDGTLPRAYRYTKTYIYVVLEVCSSGLFVTNIYKAAAQSGRYIPPCSFHFSTEQQEMLKKKLLERYLAI